MKIIPHAERFRNLKVIFLEDGEVVLLAELMRLVFNTKIVDLAPNRQESFVWIHSAGAPLPVAFCMRYLQRRVQDGAMISPLEGIHFPLVEQELPV